MKNSQNMTMVVATLNCGLKCQFEIVLSYNLLKRKHCFFYLFYHLADLKIDKVFKVHISSSMNSKRTFNDPILIFKFALSGVPAILYLEVIEATFG